MPICLVLPYTGLYANVLEESFTFSLQGHYELLSFRLLFNNVLDIFAVYIGLLDF